MEDTDYKKKILIFDRLSIDIKGNKLFLAEKVDEEDEAFEKIQFK